MKTTHYALITFLCCILSISGKSQNISFYNFTTDDGLSHNSVMSIYQDERGFMWLGTRDGVNLYNGKTFKIYKHEKDNSNSILYNDIKQITGDREGTVYFMTNNRGISAYNIKQDSFTSLVSQKTTAIYFNQKLFFASGNRIYRYEKDNIQIIYQLPFKNAIINTLYQHNDSIFIGTSNNGAYILENTSKTLSHIIPTGYIYNIFKDSSGWVWFTSYNGDGIYILKEGKIVHIQSLSNNPNTISSNQTHTCCEDTDGNIWIGTFNGLNKYNKTDHTFTRYYKTGEKNGLSESSIWSIYCDHQGTIWAGTYYGGINFFNPTKQIYQEYNISQNERDGLSSPTVGQIIEDKQQNLWMCTEGGGVCKFNLYSRKFEWYKQSTLTNSISHNHAKCIYYDQKKDVIWIGTHMGGLNKLDLKNEKFTHYKYLNTDSSSIPSDIIMDIIPYEENLILSTFNGVTIFNPENGKCQPLFTTNKEYFSRTSYSRDLIIDYQGNLWIVNMNNGVCSYNFKNQTLTNFQYDVLTPNGISSNNINTIYEDSQHRLWLCTNEHGLDLYRPQTNDFENFDIQKNGLSSNVVYAISELSPDILLVTTDNGFSIFDYKLKTFTNYNKNKEIPLTAINENSLYKASNGEIFIGGVNGMISFYEKGINHTPRSYNIFPYRLVVNGQEVLVGDNTEILAEDLTTIEEISLKPQYNIFTLEYTITDYLPYDKEEILYRLEGFSDIWTSMHDGNIITYTNLNPGEYTLVVKSSNENNPYISESKLKITILPPFYKTTIAYIIYILGTIFLFFYLIRTYKNRLKLRESLKYEKKHAEDIENLNQAKLRFFTNISHEFRTPLTIIIGQLELLLEKRTLPASIQSPILKVYRNCIQLQELITELLDFRKQTQGYMTIKVSEQNIVDFLYKHYQSFQEYATQKQINYQFIKTNDEIKAWYDAKQMRKVMNNLVSNAFKHTPEKGRITVSVRKRNEEIIIEVTDNGIGIPPQELDNIFLRFYQTEDNNNTFNTGTGIGLALTKGIIELHHGRIEVYSEPNQETCFSIHLKIGNSHFKSEEINSDANTNIETLNTKNLMKEIQLTDTEEYHSMEMPELKNGAYKILIVEDNTALREMLISLFSPFYNVLSATDGEEGWNYVNSESPDIIVSDIVMPKMSGIELCKKIKESIETCHIPVVLLTAKTTIKYNIEGLKCGADDYITKPFNVKLLLSRCNNLVNNRIMLQEKFHSQPQSSPKMLVDNTLDKEFIDKAIDIIENHIDGTDFSMELFAREMGIARTKLFTKLKAITGQTPADFILTIRLNQAAILLKSNYELNISEISDRLGFSSPKYFRKCFKDKYHITPLEYRKGEQVEETEQGNEE